MAVIRADLRFKQSGPAAVAAQFTGTDQKAIKILTLSPGGPGGPSLPEVPCGQDQRTGTGCQRSLKLSKCDGNLCKAPTARI